MKCFVLVFHHTELERQKMLDFLDTVSEVANWRANVGAIFIASEASDEKLAAKIHNKFPALRFVVAQIEGDNAQGWTDEETWDFIYRPHSIDDKNEKEKA